MRDPISVLCAATLLIIIIAALTAPWLGLADPSQTSMIHRLMPPGTPGHILGTDELGRDMLARLIFGGRLSLMLGLAPIVAATLIGATLGIIAGYIGGFVNSLIMRVMDVLYAFPSILLAVALSGVLGGGVRNSLISLTLVFIPSIARVAESVTLQVRTQDFVEAARGTGAYAHQILLAHVLRNVVGQILVFSTSLISVSIVIGAGLSFLGLGVSPPDAEWGLMLSTLRDSIYVAPFVAVLPGVMIFVTSVCFNLLGDGIRNALETRL